MLRTISTLWLTVLLSVGIFLSIGVSVQRYQKNRRAYYEQRRLVGMREVVARAEPLITAIRAYEKEHHKPPANLEALGIALPPLGPIASKGWEYSLEETSSWTLAISVDTEYTPNNGILSFGDTFAYHSNGRYPHDAYGGTLERFGAWGYYWE